MLSRSDYLTESKLTLLYLLNCSRIHLTVEQIVKCLAEHEIMNYFDISQGLAELTEARLVYSHGGTVPTYSCSNSGRSSLGEFKVRISASVREYIDKYVAENLLQLRRENENKANCVRMPDGNFLVQLKADDDDQALDIALTLSDRELAERMCEAWLKRAGDVYKFIMQTLGHQE